MSKPITLNFDEEIVTLARMHAANKGVSLSKFVNNFLREKLDKVIGYNLNSKIPFKSGPTISQMGPNK